MIKGIIVLAVLLLIGIIGLTTGIIGTVNTIMDD